MTITYSRTANELIAGAMEDARYIGVGETPTADEYAYGLVRLNLLLKSLGIDGITPWTEAEGTVTFPAATASETLSPRPIQVTDASVQVSSTYNRPLSRWSSGEYNDLPNPTQSGTPTIYTIAETSSSVSMKVWPVPSSSTTIVYHYTQVIDDLASGSDSLAVPQIWLEGIQAMLSVRLPAFGMPPQDCMLRATSYHTRLFDLSRPESYTIEAA